MLMLTTNLEALLSPECNVLAPENQKLMSPLLSMVSHCIHSFSTVSLIDVHKLIFYFTVALFFYISANGILNVTARDQVTGAEARAEIKAEKGRLTTEDIDKMIADAERYRAQDEELSQKMAYKTALEEALFTVQSKVAETNKPNEMKELADLMVRRAFVRSSSRLCFFSILGMTFVSRLYL